MVSRTPRGDQASLARARRNATRTLRRIAASLDRLPPEAATEALSRLQPALAELQAQAELALPKATPERSDVPLAPTDLLRDPVPLPENALAAVHDEDDLLDLATALLRQTATVMCICASMYEGPGPMRLDRKRAICAGLLVRTVKLFLGITLAVESEAPRDIVMILNRCGFETLTNLRFLLLRFEDDVIFDRFVKTGLSTERELYDLVWRNIRSRNDQVLPIETRMLTTIRDLCRDSDIDIDEVSSKFQDFGGGLRQRLEALGVGDRYVSLQRMPSHAAHGTWVDLLAHHLRRHPDGFAAELESWTTDPRLLVPVAFLAVEAATHYLMVMFPWEAQEVVALADRLSDLRGRLLAADALHEDVTHRDFLAR
jgi:hypothetical protein